MSDQNTPTTTTTTPNPNPNPAPAPAPAEDLADAMRGHETLAGMLFAEPKGRKSTPPKEPAKQPEPAPEPAPAPKSEPKGKAAKAEPKAATPAPEPAPAAAPAPEPPPAPAPAPERSRRPRPSRLSATEAARVAAQAAVEVMQQRQAAAPPPPAAPPAEELPDDVRQHKEVYSELETLNPQRYQGITQRMSAFRKAEAARADAWEAAHPGQGYNADDEEHQAWYEKHEPRIERQDWERARAFAHYHEIKKAEIDPRLQAMQQELAEIKSRPVADAQVQSFAYELMRNLQDNPKGTITPEQAAAWKEANSSLVSAAKAQFEELAPVIHEMTMLRQKAVTFDPKNAVHQQIMGHFREMEERLLAQGEHYNNQGQRWLPSWQYGQLAPADRTHFYTTTDADFVEYLPLYAAHKVKNRAQELKKIVEEHAAAFGFTKADAALMSHQPPSAPAPKAQPAASPSVGAGSATPPSAGTAPAPQPQTTDLVGSMLFTR